MYMFILLELYAIIPLSRCYLAICSRGVRNIGIVLNLNNDLVKLLLNLCHTYVLFSLVRRLPLDLCSSSSTMIKFIFYRS